MEDRHRERALDLRELAPLALRPAREVAARGRLRQHAVHEHGVRRDAVEREIRERAARLVHHHARGIHDQARARARLVEQDLAHVLDLVVETLDRVEDGLGRDEPPGAEARRDRAHEARRAPLDVEEVLHEQAQHVGEAQQPQRRAGRRAVDHADVVLAERLDHAHRAQRHQLLEPREHEQLLGHQLVGVGAQEGVQPLLDLRPRAVELGERRHLLRDHARRDLDGLRRRPCGRARRRRCAPSPSRAGRRDGRARRRPAPSPPRGSSCPRHPFRCRAARAPRRPPPPAAGRAKRTTSDGPSSCARVERERREAARQHEQAPAQAGGDRELVVDLGDVEPRRVGARERHARHVVLALAREAHARERARAGRPARRRAKIRAPCSASFARPVTSSGASGAASTGSGAKSSSTSRRRSSWRRPHSRKKASLGGALRQQAVHHHGVAGHLEERELRPGAARFVDHHALGRHHQPHARRRVRDALLERRAAGRRAAPRRRGRPRRRAAARETRRRASGVATPETARKSGSSTRSARCATSGSVTRRSVESVGAQSTTTRS